MKLTMTQSKLTKNTVVFQADEQDAGIPVLYVQKSAFDGDTFPTNVEVTVTEFVDVG